MELSNIIGVVFLEITEEELNQLLSQMSKSQIETGREFFYILSSNVEVKQRITQTYFKDIAYSNLSKQDEIELLKEMDYIISSKEFSKDKALKGKKIIIPSEKSFYFDIPKNIIKKIL